MSGLLELFWAFVQVGAFSVGGGYVAMPLIQDQVCRLHPWLTADEFANLVTIAEMTPGPIAINAATFVGTRLGGLPGAVAATLGCILPSCIIVSLLSLAWRRWHAAGLMQDALGALRPVVVALIAGAAWSLVKTALWQGAPALANTDLLQLILLAGALVLLRRKKWNPILTMLLCGVVYTILNAPKLLWP